MTIDCTLLAISALLFGGTLGLCAGFRLGRRDMRPLHVTMAAAPQTGSSGSTWHLTAMDGLTPAEAARAARMAEETAEADQAAIDAAHEELQQARRDDPNRVVVARSPDPLRQDVAVVPWAVE